jgi:hypothetical protein
LVPRCIYANGFVEQPKILMCRKRLHFDHNYEVCWQVTNKGAVTKTQVLLELVLKHEEALLPTTIQAFAFGSFSSVWAEETYDDQVYHAQLMHRTHVGNDQGREVASFLITIKDHKFLQHFDIEKGEIAEHRLSWNKGQFGNKVHFGDILISQKPVEFQISLFKQKMFFDIYFITSKKRVRKDPEQSNKRMRECQIINDNLC